MQDSDQTFALQARWLFPVAAPPIPGGTLTVRDGVIAAVGENRADRAPMDLGDAAIVPGLVNPHTHLEFSDCERPLGEPGMAFPDWIREVIAWRRQRDASEVESRRRRQNALEHGLRESLTHGVTTLGEIASPGWPEAPFRTASLDCTVFQELLGLEPDRREPLLQLARDHLAAGKRSSAWRPAVSPHAPYTAPLDLVEEAAKLSHQEGIPVAMHLAESWEEMELLRSGSGPFYEFLSSLSASLLGAVTRGLRPLDYLERLALGKRALVVHGNYLDDEERGFLAERAERMTVVYCPRTHAWFGHGRYPLAEMLSRGVQVALGTDSRASNPDLSLLEEMRFVARRFPGVPPAMVLKLGTQAGAEALGLGAQCGILAPGRRADLAVIAIPSRHADDPHELLFNDESRIVGTYVGGVRADSAPSFPGPRDRC